MGHLIHTVILCINGYIVENDKEERGVRIKSTKFRLSGFNLCIQQRFSTGEKRPNTNIKASSYSDIE